MRTVRSSVQRIFTAFCGAAVLFSSVCADASDPMTDAHHPAYVRRTVLPDNARARREMPTVEDLRAYAPARAALVDPAATAETRALYAYLAAVGRAGYVIYGHQNDAHHKAFRTEDGTNSDTKDAVGALAGIVGMDALSLTGEELELTEAERAAGVTDTDKLVRIACDASREGAILTFSMHMPNFARVARRPTANGRYDFSGYSPRQLSGNVVRRCLPGGDLRPVYTAYLDLVADFARRLSAEGIPLLFRPLHEHNGDWFWWGARSSSTEDFAALWRATVEYLRDEKGVHNLIYVYSPNGPFDAEEAYLDRYPGDDYADVFGFDLYDDDHTDAWIGTLDRSAAVVARAAARHAKIAALTEVGVHMDGGGLALTGNADKAWYAEISALVRRYHMPYFMTWANFEKERRNFYQPYMTDDAYGHEMIDGFVAFYNEPSSLFADGIADYRRMPVSAR